MEFEKVYSLLKNSHNIKEITFREIYEFREDNLFYDSNPFSLDMIEKIFYHLISRGDYIQNVFYLPMDMSSLEFMMEALEITPGLEYLYDYIISCQKINTDFVIKYYDQLGEKKVKNILRYGGGDLNVKERLFLAKKFKFRNLEGFIQNRLDVFNSHRHRQNRKKRLKTKDD